MGEDLGYIILSVLCGLGWIAFLGATTNDPTELPNGCILYEDKIYCVEE